MSDVPKIAMRIKKLVLKNFRNYAQKTLNFTPQINLIVGSNAAGKTNILEALCLLASGKSFRVRGVESEMINYGQEVASVKGETDDLRLGIVLTTGEVMAKKTAKKRYLVNEVGKRAVDFIGQFRAVYFGPEELELVTDSPSIRRKYLDFVLSQVDREYTRASLSYEKGLRTRNRLLEEMRESGFGNKKRLYFWDQMLIKNGNIITARRQELIDFFNSHAGLWLPANQEELSFRIEYNRSSISSERLSKYEKEEIAAAATLVGPHRDDFAVKIKSPGEEERDLATFGSRGEERLAILWLKLAELEFIKEKTKQTPVLLLDDIFSELDANYRQLVLAVVREQQTIITTTDLAAVEKENLKGANVVEL